MNLHGGYPLEPETSAARSCATAQEREKEMRPPKTGLDWYPHNTKMSDELRMMMNLYGLQGYGWYYRLLDDIHGGDGYFLHLDRRKIIMLAAEMRISDVVFRQMIDSALDIDLFDRRRYELYGILTSLQVQTDYFNATERRTHTTVRAEYLLYRAECYPHVQVVGDYLDDCGQHWGDVRDRAARWAAEAASEGVDNYIV